LAHFLPDWKAWLRSVIDTRRQEMCTYTGGFLTVMGLMLFLLKLGARRCLRFALNTAEALANLNRLSGARQEKLAHDGTVDHFLGHVHPRELDTKLRRNLARRLVRMKALDYARLYGHFLIVFDGTGMLVFWERHCEHCLEMTLNGRKIYYHHVLEAKLVTPDGLAISVGSEFIENTDPHATKQDCELKAFARLAPRLKRDFPQLRLCLLLDALYASGSVLATCEGNHWKYFITFKEGSLPAVWQDYQALLGMCPENRKPHDPTEGCHQEFAWMEGLSYVDDQGREHVFNALECREEKGDQQHFFAWITNFSVRADNVAALGNRGGRLRSKIENEGFNIQKNGGFGLEHAYSYGDWQIKNFYILMQVAHAILQLLEHGDLLETDCQRLYGSLAAMARRLAEAIRNYALPSGVLDSSVRIRVRLDSS
jgi:hypothetical protein